MRVIDQVIGMDWTHSQQVGDGVYIVDATQRMGTPSIAVRTDRETGHQVIVMESQVFTAFIQQGQQIIASYGADSPS